jgi:S-adenosylmethionine hydrolase
MASVITLTTDFGLSGPYVGAMKGVILSINPAAQLVDITHSISPQDIRQAAMVLEGATPWFPAGTIHLVVVDPGVGTERGIIYAEIGNQRYVCPDNGLLDRLTLKNPPTRIISLSNSQHWASHVSATFHGRDIMAPVAARLSLGLDPAELGLPQDKLIALGWPQPKNTDGEIVGSVIWIDDFGNLITNISDDMLANLGFPRSLSVEILDHTIPTISHTYGDQPIGKLIALVGSSGQLEIARVNESAEAMLDANVGAHVIVHL